MLGLLFELEYHNGENAADIIHYAEECRDFQKNEYIGTVFFGACEKLPLLDERIERHAVGWKKDRMSGVSLAIMRLSVYEMLFMEEIPDSVSINEAVELAKLYDDDAAPAFINGVLNAVLKEKAAGAQTQPRPEAGSGSAVDTAADAEK